MPPLTASRGRCRLGTISGCRRGITQGGAAFTAKAFVRLDGCATFRAGGEEGRPAFRTEFAPLPIFAAAFGTAHTFPLGAMISLGQVEAFIKRPSLNARRRLFGHLSKSVAACSAI